MGSDRVIVFFDENGFSCILPEEEVGIHHKAVFVELMEDVQALEQLQLRQKKLAEGQLKPKVR